MTTARIIYHIARADFLERVRRYSFLITLGAVVFLGYQAAIGNINMQAGNYRGEYNSAWVGSMMAVIATFFLGWFGFYLVKGSLARDRETGVGQIMATTPLKRPLYTFGKWLSNFAVLTSMVFILAFIGIILQIFKGESNQVDFVMLLFPFFFIALPMLALVAAIAVLFESIGFLQGGIGNIVYFFIFILMLPLADSLSKINPGIEPLGFGLIQESMDSAAKADFPEFGGGFILGSTDTPIVGVFHWSGVDWTPDVILKRLSFFGIAMVLILIASAFFDRFDPSHWKPRRSKSSGSPTTPEPVPVKQILPAVQLTPISDSINGVSIHRLIILELKLLFKGLRWWWFFAAGGLFIASLINPPENIRAYILPFTWLWPILIWSGMGSREIRHNVGQMVFSCASPLPRQLPATWFAGFIVAILTGGGAAISFIRAGDYTSLLVWFSAALFIPSLALTLGIWSNSSKLFEILHVSMWYLAMNKIDSVDYFGANSNGNIGFFIPLSLSLIIFAFVGRAREIQS